MRLLREGWSSWGSAWGTWCFLGVLGLGPLSMLQAACPFPFLLCPALAEHP